MPLTTEDLEMTVWAAAEGRATPAELAELEADPKRWLRTLVRLIAETEEKLESVRRLGGLDREYAEPDLLDDLIRLWDDRRHLTGEAEPVLVPPPPPVVTAPTNGKVHEPEVILEPEPVVLQASWAEGLVIVWAAGRGSPPAGNDDLADRLEAAGAPAHGWSTHAPVELPAGRADALAIPLAGSLGWLIAAAAQTSDGVGPSVTWMGRVALAAVRLLARGGVVPALRNRRQSRF